MSRRSRKPASAVDQVEYLTNKKKINLDHLIKLKPLTNTQNKVFSEYGNGKNLVLSGFAGVGKSFVALFLALREVLDTTTLYESVVLIRSTVPSRDQGFLPGCQPYHSKVLTPTGWHTMGDVKPGDYVISASGASVKVLQIFEKGVKPVYKITTEQGNSTECCADHIWYTTTAEQKKRGKPGSLKSTADIINTLHDNKVNLGYTNHYLPKNGIVEYDSRTDIKIPAYTLGVLIGDGNLSNHVSFSSIDFPIIDKVRNELVPLNYNVTNVKNTIHYNISTLLDKPNKCSGTFSIGGVEYNSIADMCVQNTYATVGALKDRCYRGITINNIEYKYNTTTKSYTNDIKQYLHEYDLLYKKAWEKSIPDDYKYGSIHTRMELIKGLMDTDGTIKKTTGETSYTTTSEKLALDIQEVVRSLGGRCIIYKRDRIGRESYFNGRKIIHRRISYELCINLNFAPFSLDRKANLWRPSKFAHQDGIKTVEYLYDMPVKCILLDDEDHLYITDNFIVTHNTIEEKTEIYELPYKGILKKLFVERLENTIHDELKTQKTYKFLSSSYVRGTTIDNSVIIVDEFQNYTFQELDSIITRVGINSKIIFCGDTNQSDLLKEKPQHQDFLNILKTIDSFSFIEFKIEDIVRSGLVRAYIIAKDKLGK